MVKDALAGALAPIAGGPCASRVAVREQGRAGVGRLEVASVGSFHDLVGHAGKLEGGGRHAAFVLVVERDGGSPDGLHPGTRGPGEVGVGEQAVVALDGRKVVPKGVAVALRVEDGGVGLGDAALLVAHEAGDAVVEGIGGLAGTDALGEVPVEAVVHRRDGDGRGGGVIDAPEQGEFLLEERRHDALEGEQAGGAGAKEDVVQVARAPGDGGVLRVGQRLVTQEGIEVVELAGRLQERGVDVGIGVAGVDAEVAGALEEGLVGFDEPAGGGGVHVERDGPHVAAPGLREDAGLEVHVVVDEGVHPLLEGVDPVHGAGEPALDEGGRGPCAPVGVDGVGGGAAPACGEVLVLQGLDAGPAEDDAAEARRGRGE